MVVLDEWREVGVVTLWGKEDDERVLRRGLEKPPEAQWVDQEICGRIPRRWCKCNGNKRLVSVCVCLSVFVVFRVCREVGVRRWLRGVSLSHHEYPWPLWLSGYMVVTFGFFS